MPYRTGRAIPRILGAALLVGVIAVLAAGASTANQSVPALPWGTPHTTPASAPSPGGLIRPAGTSNGVVSTTTPNWSGLVSAGGSVYTEVSATWIVPALQPSNTTRYAASWVGIDGYNSSTVLQTGTAEATAGPTAGSYSAWMEDYPAQPTSVNIGAVNPGDAMTGTVRQVAGTAWAVTIKDNSTGQAHTTDYTYTGQNASADWIVEDPNQPPAPFADFGTDPFSAMTLNGAPVTASALTSLRMVQNGSTLAYPTAASGQTFTDVYAGPATTYNGCDGNIPAGEATSMASTPDGGGYWIVSSAGQVVACGDAVNHGGLLGTTLNRPIVGVAADPATGGYWLVGSDGGVFAFDAPFYGSTGALKLNSPIVGISGFADGYRFVAADGGIFDYGVPFLGSAA